jgi:hypothetical protein
MPPKQPDLRTTVVSLDVAKCSNLHSLREQAKEHWSIRGLQPLFPSLERLFKLESVRVPYHYGIKSKNVIQTIADATTVYSAGKGTPVHRKTTMLLSPYRWMRGDFGMPAEQSVAKEMHDRLQSPHNAAYVGALAYSVLSESGCKHFPKVYGTFTGTAEKHIIDISDDYEDLCSRPWFVQNIGHFFELKMKPVHDKPLLELSNEEVKLEIEELEPARGEQEEGNSYSGEELEQIELEEEEYDSEDDESVSTGYVFHIQSCDSEGSSLPEDMAGEDYEEEEEAFAEAIFKDVPVQTTVMEACTGTLFQLFRLHKDPVKWHDWLAQVVFALAYAQRNYGLVHNDLHVNNVMYVSTEEEYLYYNNAGQVFRVPTHGYLLKIIDFDRATFSVRLQGMRESKFFMSDQFMLDEEAGGQYNLEPFYNSKYPEIKPNASFDLVRLATSLFWDCYPKGPMHEEYKEDKTYQLLMQWLTLPDGSSILFKDPETSAHDRYHGFHLYKAIARYCKDTAVPRKVIQESYSKYKVDKAESACLVIEA